MAESPQRPCIRLSVADVVARADSLQASNSKPEPETSKCQKACAAIRDASALQKAPAREENRVKSSEAAQPEENGWNLPSIASESADEEAPKQLPLSSRNDIDLSVFNSKRENESSEMMPVHSDLSAHNIGRSESLLSLMGQLPSLVYFSGMSDHSVAGHGLGGLAAVETKTAAHGGTQSACGIVEPSLLNGGPGVLAAEIGA
eukprot:CAMPEP_0177717030 /NCGR_PEP_ID=MMETSP0484_2-20121128/14815_1 /TAXON_ID=354590 /ORGANISM="Rhodomonas lens, Strain RHODO" /LENGTH=202 /DNA_ID=CAMNT_0019229079 /DNA_START=212 /DNA_END=821 /DNA_ORIENTATION=-